MAGRLQRPDRVLQLRQADPRRPPRRGGQQATGVRQVRREAVAGKDQSWDRRGLRPNMAQTATAPEIPAPRLKVHYRTELRQRLQQELGLPNIMQVPRPVKIVINMGVGDAIRESRQLEGAVRDLTAITGQKPQVTKAKQSIAGFKIREGQSIGAKVTLRGDRMWEFLDRLVSVAPCRICVRELAHAGELPGITKSSW